ncbi:CDP-diacylglycerol--glycerol-3-phosphate 3-phosphatidyltransferase/cardiolipin synthase [Methylovirgula ligni]|uniref:CDP-diacylglycerol--glycerol-3-phosphate 3-phosphatidyltransferase n=1 Tax=Methylovirgula ligni TaxID=569860 RepID=A0A3D9YQ40_9HYPH|nr:CDP-diacylglycerol--glycerol-3-phosphate 3-phosphatidyltransferase/cardiolipin synthase [Methylovirgula ligni]
MFPPGMAVFTFARGSSRRFNLPNLLTYGRVAAVPVVVGCLFWPEVAAARWAALAIFVLAGISDFLDGYLARALAQQSSLGRMLDPIADKLLVSAVLLMLAADHTIASFSLWAAIIILCREILVSGLREFLAELKVSLPVSRVAKWKTTLQLVALGFLIAGPAAEPYLPGTTRIGLGLLWVSAILTLYTGWDYFTAGVKHLLDHDDFGSKRPEIMNAIDSHNLERDLRENPVSTFSHPALDGDEKP